MRLPDLSYRDGSSWRPLSEWMNFFLQVGRLLVEVHVPDNRLVVGITVPTRAYAAVLAGAGVEWGGRRLLMIQTQRSEKGGLKVSCSERDCLGVQPVGVDVPLRQGNERGRPLGPTVCHSSRALCRPGASFSS
jgi:hypothetical protein